MFWNSSCYTELTSKECIYEPIIYICYKPLVVILGVCHHKSVYDSTMTKFPFPPLENPQCAHLLLCLLLS